MTTFEKVTLLDCDLQKVVLSGPLSRETTFVLHITGPYSDVEVNNLIKLLELQRTWLVRDKASEADAERK